MANTTTKTTTTITTAIFVLSLCNVILFSTTDGYIFGNGQDDGILRDKKFILGSDSKQSWTTLEQFSSCALTCVPGFEKLTQVCCDTGLDAICSNLPWASLKAKLGTCVDLSASGITSKAWSSLEQFAACFLSCVPGFEKLMEVCCQSGLDAVCTNLPWDTLKPSLGQCQGSSVTSSPLVTSQANTSPPTKPPTTHSPTPHWLLWAGWTCSMQNGECVQLRYRHCSTGRDIDCPGKTYELQLCTKAACPDMFTTTPAPTTQATTTPLITCQDDPNAPGCKDPSIITEICKDSQIALSVCPRSCGLCDQVQATAVNKYTSGSIISSVPTSAVTTDTCQDDVASGACGDPTVLAALCNDNAYAWRFCPKSCNKCDTCWDYLNCSDRNAQALFCGREDFALQYCRKTCGKCNHKPVPVTVNVCGDPVANELICELLHNEICICNDPSVRSLCGNFCADRCATKVSSLPACKPVSSISSRRRRDEVIRQLLLV
ncbi:uncharacterized protein LOC132739225 [Ruditapes philippinarum]|uniref:uncharacterized protein LOC132739225 n=1 Tax=Ruditapes philippinarum TaxID=129788 RepID=UPI00295C2604|nr:uncharacterized protein LOC132739225 [Ruditapes philippinarum]